VRLALESDRPIAQIAADLGIHPEALRKRVPQAKVDAGKAPSGSAGRWGVSTNERLLVRNRELHGRQLLRLRLPAHVEAADQGGRAGRP
jgi:transposase-like protein